MLSQCFHNVVRVGGYIYTAFRMFREWMRCGLDDYCSLEEVPEKRFHSSVPLCHAGPITIAPSIYLQIYKYTIQVSLSAMPVLLPLLLPSIHPPLTLITFCLSVEAVFCPHLPFISTISCSIPLIVNCCTLSPYYLGAETGYRVVTPYRRM